MSDAVRYRMRNPVTGREIIFAAKPGEVYKDRDTGEHLEVVGKVLPLPPSKSQPAVGRRVPAYVPVVRPAVPARPERVPQLRPAYGAVVAG